MAVRFENDLCPEISCLAEKIINTDSTQGCPSELTILGESGRPAGCMSTCSKFGNPRDCCTANSPYGTPETCTMSDYSIRLKNVCPNIYTYAFDDSAGTFTCNLKGQTVMTVEFCPQA